MDASKHVGGGDRAAAHGGGLAGARPNRAGVLKMFMAPGGLTWSGGGRLKGQEGSLACSPPLETRAQGGDGRDFESVSATAGGGG
jgi:hypothetical protein